MTLYSLVLFVHVTAVLVLFAALSFEVLSLFHLRRASTLAEVHLWIELVPKLPLVVISLLLVILFSGGYLTAQISAFSLAWPWVAVAAILLLAPPGVMTGARMRAMSRACASAKAINSDLLGRLRDPFLKVSLGIRIAVLLGIVLLMAAKPELWESVGIVGASVVLGLLSSLVVSRRTAWLPAPGTDIGD